MAQTKKKRTGRLLAVPIALLLVLCIAAYLYFSRSKNPTVVVHPPAQTTKSTPAGSGTLHRQAVQPAREAPHSIGESPAGDPSGETAAQETPGVDEEPLEEEPLPEEDASAELQEAVSDFFSYLDEQPYAEGVLTGTDSWTVFKNAVSKLSEHPPASAGEGLDPMVMSKNVYHFFRALNDRELTLAREILRNEDDTLEINLDLFFRWLMATDARSDPEGVRPSQEVLYKYSSFFMNTVGGRAYLFRRSMKLRLLVSYYAVQILHKAELEGRNKDGVDILPLARDVRYGLSLQPDLYFKDTYLDTLTEIVQVHESRR